MAWYRSPFLLPLLLTTFAAFYSGTSAQADEADSHICNEEVWVNEVVNASCSKFYEMVLSGALLNRDISGMGTFSDSKVEKLIKRYIINPGISPICSFDKKKKRTVKCCLGWEGTTCDRAICIPTCKNGGTCTSPNKCKCTALFVGRLCQESLQGVTAVLKLCYASMGCYGKKAEVGSGAMTQKECCQSGGTSWGVSSGIQKYCSTCPKYQANLQVSNIEVDPNAAFHTCMGYGPSYYRTFDGTEYTFAGRCSYTLYHETETIRSVTVKIVNCEKSSTCRKELTIVLNQAATIVALGSTIEINNVLTTITPARGYSNPDAGFTKKKKVPTATLR